MTPSCEVRVAIPGDEDLLANLNCVVQDVHIRARPDVFKPTVAKEVADWFSDLLVRPTATIWIADLNGVAAGYLVLLEHARNEHAFCYARRWFEIDHIAVAPEYQRRGDCSRPLASRLMSGRRSNRLAETTAH